MPNIKKSLITLKLTTSSKLFLIISVFFLLTLFTTPASFADSTTNNNYVTTSEIVNNAPNVYNKIKWVTIDDIKKNLPSKPIVVGFDIDDTILLSSPCFYKLQKDFEAKHNLSGKPQDIVFPKIIKDKEFWNSLASCDVYSLPKKSAIDLIHMHQQRGDQIYFITGRNAPSDKSLLPILNNILVKLIGSNKGLHDVIYSDNASKTPFIKQYKINIYYGDGDGDITNAREAGATGIRFLRSSISTYKPLPLAGQFGEQVLVGSDS
ncbi:HAD family acid phosphatase [Rickettsiales bacterium LUAb2]